MKKSVFCVIIILFFDSDFINAGWGVHAHKNYLKEAITILNYNDYMMCLSYKDDLMKGITEGEIQFKYRAQGKYPLWMGETSEEEVSILQGLTIDSNHIDQATEFFFNKINELQIDVKNMRKPYTAVMFELGYIIHSINNILIPLYETGHYPEQQLASHTENIELSIKELQIIDDLHQWINKMIKRKIEIRQMWTDFANNKDREGFIVYSEVANKENIYTIASILKYINSESYGPADPEVREKLEKHHENKINKVNGRKPWD